MHACLHVCVCAYLCACFFFFCVLCCLPAIEQQAAHTTETRLVLCEAISKVARLCGPLLPHYRRVFLNSLLAACRDNDALVRSAALSCLADVVGLLRFSLGTCLQEVCITFLTLTGLCNCIFFPPPAWYPSTRVVHPDVHVYAT